MTQPQWAVGGCKTVVDIIKENEAKHGIKEQSDYPQRRSRGKRFRHMWRGRHWEAILKTLKAAQMQGRILAGESVGKEVHDETVMYCDISKSIFAYPYLDAKI